jgi:hypothetical protein
MPVSQYRSEFCLNLYSASPFRGSSSLLLKMAMAFFSICFTKRLRLSVKIAGSRGRYFMVARYDFRVRV